MAEFHSQNWLFQKRNIIKQTVRPIVIEKAQKQYLKRFYKKYQDLIILVFLLIFWIVLFETGIPILIDIYVRHYANLLEHQKLYIAFGAVVVFLMAYGLVSFSGIKYEKSLVIALLNDLRHKWFSHYLKRPLFFLKHDQKANLLSKVTYHFSLLQMGISNTLFSLAHWALLTFGVLIISFFLNSTLFVLAALMVPVNFLIAFLGYMVSKYYVSQDQTMYSKILRYMSQMLDEFPLIKLKQSEASVLRYFDRMVDIDSYFRVRRELWMKFGYSILFFFIALFGAGVYILEIYYPFLEIEYSGQAVVYGIIFALIIKLLYLSLRVGLFSFPLKLGLALSIPTFSSESRLPPLNSFTRICFRSAKVKLKKDTYLKNVDFCFKRGGRILFHGGKNSGKSKLARILSGSMDNKTGKPWLVIVDKKRYSYNNWKRRMTGIAFIHPEFHTDETALEILTEKPKEEVSALEMETIIRSLQPYEILEFIFENKALGQKLRNSSFTLVQKTLLQLAHCLLRKPDLVIIDNVLLDINHDDINEMLCILSRKLKQSILIYFSSKDNNLIPYDQKHLL